jgi:hypothetical protein
MKRVIVTALISLVALSVAAPAPAAGPTVQSLARQIKVLQKEIKTLKAQVTQARAAALSSLVYSACSTAATADALQGTWTALDAKLTPTHGVIFGPQTPVNDYQTCQPLRITRAPTQQPPNAGVFNSLLALFR